MASPPESQGAQTSGASGSQQSGYQPYMLLEFLRAEPTVTERVAGVVPPRKGDKDKTGRDDKAKRAIKEFENAWANASY
ncbi:hypothetical protein F4811DRAFT_363196 [Daldinia bambusicola]|nr:hypothetical protein F4811DRAFT_363196 [Daldinia bambusicola]